MHLCLSLEHLIHRQGIIHHLIGLVIPSTPSSPSSPPFEPHVAPPVRATRWVTLPPLPVINDYALCSTDPYVRPHARPSLPFTIYGAQR
ncbi:hypothetical protein L249_7218 [Ophiocordyceps polyrhachis-furcata BCC 54312]|uniref:Uncharacterized protein n=1 Tax=Ophiocordyceps polyrhachis-furcata BCC 54312 TaxID=1330021 RepID=A0A367LB74_9HYPO|nr:hypothetical protein L249_7218 [Ophiocordyceps polyrhachis-furcata BCC 54312]